MKKGKVFAYANPFRFYPDLPIRVNWFANQQSLSPNERIRIAGLKPLPNDTVVYEDGNYSIERPRQAKGIVYADGTRIPTLIYGQLPYSRLTVETSINPDTFHAVTFPIKQNETSDAYRLELDNSVKFQEGTNLLREMAMVKFFYDLPVASPEPFPKEEMNYRQIMTESVHASRLIDVNADSDIKSLPSTADRYNLINRTIYTVDSETTKDIDDALEVRRISETTYLLGIHIADVSEFITASSARDKDAESRATSHYLADSVIHMLPAILSEELCSLNENENRLAVSVYAEVEVSESGLSIKGIRFAKSVIRSKAKLTYNTVEAVLNGNASVMDQAIVESLHAAKQLADRIEADTPYKDISYGSTNIKYCEDTNGKVNRNEGKLRSSDRLIEMFMVTANRLVGEKIAATIVSTNSEPCGIGAYRIQAVPNDKDLQDYLAKLRRANLVASTVQYDDLRKKSEATASLMKEIQALSEQEKSDLIRSLIYRQIHKAIKNMESETTRIKLGVLSRFGEKPGRIMKKASLSDKVSKSFHVSLGISRYAWFTSPIRRYTDIINHRVLKATLTAGGTIASRTNVEELSRKVNNGDYAESNFNRRMMMYYLCDQRNLQSVSEMKIKITSFEWTTPGVFTIQGRLERSYNVSVRIAKRPYAKIEGDGLACIMSGKTFQVGDMVVLIRPDVNPHRGYVVIPDCSYIRGTSR